MEKLFGIFSSWQIPDKNFDNDSNFKNLILSNKLFRPVFVLFLFFSS